MFLGEGVVGQRLLDRPLHKLGCSGQPQAPQLLDHLHSLLPGRRDVLDGMDRLEHRRDQTLRYQCTVQRCHAACMGLSESAAEFFLLGSFADAENLMVEEPLPADSPLWAMEHVLITPHTAGETCRYEDGVLAIMQENLARLSRGETELLNQVV
jgi:hypothetical protein